MSAFQKQFLSASCVCSNCFRQVRREAIKPVRYKHADVDDELNRLVVDGDYVCRYSERLRKQTVTEDVPGEPPSESHKMFCECGAPDPHTRLWGDHDVVTDPDAGLQEVGVGRDRFRELLTAAIVTAVQLDLVATRSEAKRVAAAAWGWFDAGASVNRTLKEAFAELPSRRRANSPRLSSTAMSD